MSRRDFQKTLSHLVGLAGLSVVAGCGGGGIISGEPKKYEGGGPLPELKGEETPEPSSTKKKK